MDDLVQAIRDGWPTWGEAKRAHYLLWALRFRDWLIHRRLVGAEPDPEVQQYLRVYDEILAQAATLKPTDGLPWEIWREQWGGR